MIGKTEEWLVQELKEQGVQQVEQVFYCSYEEGQVHFQLKMDYQ